jgi:hypothetical protein
MTGPKAWDAEIRPRLVPRLSLAVAALIAVTGIVVAILNNRASGAAWRGVDQIAIGGLAVLIAGAIAYTLTRPRLRVGPAGLAVRNVLEERVIPWSQVVDFTFPAGKRWARVDLEAYEYIPVLAIQSADRERAVEAMDAVRTLMADYRPNRGAAPRY